MGILNIQALFPWDVEEEPIAPSIFDGPETKTVVDGGGVDDQDSMEYDGNLA